MDGHGSNQQRGGDLTVSQRWSSGRGSCAGVARRGRRCSQMTQIGVDVMRSRVIELGLCGVHQHRNETSEAPEGEIEHKGKLEANQQC